MMVRVRSKSQSRKPEKLHIESLEHRLLLASDWQNPIDPVDVDGSDNEGATPLDALTIINELTVATVSDPETRRLPDLGPEEGSPPPFFDVDGDQVVSPLDALMVINAIPDQSGGNDMGDPTRGPDSVVVGTRAAAAHGIGRDTLVNTTTDRAQTFADVASWSDGSFITVWNSARQDGSAMGVFAQRYDSSGAKLGDEFQVNTETHRGQQRPAVATDRDGGFSVVWQSLGQDGSGWGIYGQRFDDTANPVGGEFQINHTTRGNQYMPDVAVLTDGDLVVTWEGRGESDHRGIYMRRFDSSGMPVTDEILVNEHEQGAQRRPAIAGLNDNDFVVSWDGRGSEDDQGIFFRHFDSSGGSTEMHVGSSPSLRQIRSSLSSGPNGEFLVGWQERPEPSGGWGTRAQMYDSSLMQVGPEIHANQTTTGLQEGISTAILSDGSFVVAWSGRGPGDHRGVFTRMYNASGEAVTDEHLTNETTRARQSRVSMAALGTGYVTLWDGFGDADHCGVYARFIDGDPGDGENNPPVLVQPIPDQSVPTDSSFSLDAASFFADPDPGDSLTFSSTALPSWLNLDETTGVFSGTPAISDVDSFDVTVEATDLAGESASDVFSITVFDSTSEFTITGLVFADADGSGSRDGGEAGISGVNVMLLDSLGTQVDSTTTGSGGDYSFTADSGTYTLLVTAPGVPTADPDGTLDNLTVIALNANISGVEFGYNRTPVLNVPLDDRTASVGALFEYDVSAFFSDPDGSTLSYASSALPSWLGFDPVSGIFSGTPTANDVGTLNITATATDPGSLFVSDAFQIDVMSSSMNQAPVFMGPIPDDVTPAGTPYGKDITSFFSDPDPGDTLTYTAMLTAGGALPTWLDLDRDTGLFSGTPAIADAGQFDITVTASDGLDSASGAYSLTVTANQAPVLTTPIADQTIDVSQMPPEELDLNIAQNFSDPDGDMLTYAATRSDGMALPSWVAFDGDTGQFTGAPTAADIDTFDVLVTASDGETTTSDTFSIMVIGDGDPFVQNPIADQLASVEQLFSLDVSNTFADPDGDDLTLTVTTTLPGWLMFDGSEFSGTPAQSDLGQVTEITVSAMDPGGGMAMDTFSLTVVDNQPPALIAPIPDMSITGGIPYQFSAGSFFTDPDPGDTLSFSSSALPTWLMLDDVTGVFSGTPPLAEVGTNFDVTVTAADESLASVSDTFNVTITSNSPPTATNIPDQVALVDLNLFLRTSEAFSDPDAGDDLTYTAMLSGGGAVPDWLELDANTGLLTGTPETSDIGQIDVIITATDLAGQSASTAPFQIDVTDQGTAVEVTLTTVDAEGIPINTVAPGQTYTLVGSVQDVRTAPTGVFSAYWDVTYTAALTSVSGSIVHSSTYAAGTSGDTGTPGLIDEVGGTDGTSQLGGGLFEVFRVEMTAGISPGTINFDTDMAEDQVQHPLLIFSEMGATPPAYVDYGSTTLIIAAGVQAPDVAMSASAAITEIAAPVTWAPVRPAERAVQVPVDLAIRTWAADAAGDVSQRPEEGTSSEAVVDSLFAELFGF